MEVPMLIPPFLKVVILFGVSLWLTIAVFNNLTDSGTNISMVGQMMRMDPIDGNPQLGRGLRWRAITSPRAHKRSFYTVVGIQLVSAVLMWRAAVLMLVAAWGSFDPGMVAYATSAVNLGLGVLTVLWLWFLCGGLWFGYWLKMPQVQQTHLSMFFITLLTMLVMNAR